MPELDLEKLSKIITLKSMAKKTTMCITIDGGVELGGQFYKRLTPKKGKHTIMIYVPRCYQGLVKVFLQHPKRKGTEYHFDMSEDTHSYKKRVKQDPRENQSIYRKAKKHADALETDLNMLDSQIFYESRHGNMAKLAKLIEEIESAQKEHANFNFLVRELIQLRGIEASKKRKEDTHEVRNLIANVESKIMEHINA